MPINFPQLLQDSWNFIRNRSQFSITAVILLVIVQVIITSAQFGAGLTQSSSAIAAALLLGVANIYISVLIILNIKSINEGNFLTFFKNAGQAFTKLLPTIAIYIIMTLPMSFGTSSILAGSILGSEVSPFAFLSLVIGFFIFMRLNLAIYTLLVENSRVLQAVKFTWQLTKGKMLVLVGYNIIANLLPVLVSSLIGQLGNHIAVMLFSFIISAFLSLFTTIFGFRFYQTIRPKTGN